jgi:hypothetical protein
MGEAAGRPEGEDRNEPADFPLRSLCDHLPLQGEDMIADYFFIQPPSSGFQYWPGARRL